MMNIMNPPADWSTLKKLIWLRGTPITGGEELTVSGTPPLSLPNSLGKPLKAWSVDVLPYQEGTGDPAPDNVRPIHGTDKLTIYTDSKYGGLVDWNQCVVNGNFINDSGLNALNTTKSASNNILTLVPDGRYSSTLHYGAGAFNNVGSVIATGHKYYFTCGIMATVTDKFRARISDKFIWSDTIPANTWGECTGIVNITNDSDIVNTIYAYDDALYTTNDRIHLRNLMVCDLTKMFGAGNEPSTVEAFRALFPNDYYAYNAGQQMTVDQVNGAQYSPAVLTLPQTVYTGTIGSEGGESRQRKRVLNGSENWTGINTSGIYMQLSGMKKFTDYNVSNRMFCENLSVAKNHNNMSDFSITGYADYTSRYPNQNWLYIRIDDEHPDATSVKQWLAENPVTVVYDIAEPDQLSLTVPPIPTPTGTATTWATAEDGTVDSMEVTYVGKA